MAHELRTPLAGLRSTAEVALRGSRKPEEFSEALNDSLAIVLLMQSMVEKLHLLARLAEGRIELQKDNIQLSKLLNDSWKTVAEEAKKRELILDNQLPKELCCVSDANCLMMALTNILKNAVDYSEDKGRIWVAGRASDEAIEITVSNTGCTLTQEQVSHVFERLWRADQSRTDTGIHSGLGLSVVQQIVTALGGKVAVTVEGNVFSITLCLPPKDKISQPKIFPLQEDAVLNAIDPKRILPETAD